MDNFYKVCWAIRLILFKPFFGRFILPGYLGKPIFLLGIKKAFIGKRVRIFPHLRLEVHGEGQLIIHDNVSIGQGLHITCGESIEIHSGTVISGSVMITDIDHEYQIPDTPILEQKHNHSPVMIGENCFIGLGVRLQAGTKLGKQCVIGANSVVRGTFPDYSVIVGAPAKVVKQFNGEEWVKVNST
jgi:acetyltransferase-like isoleucine patch superfamily enzyme